MKNKIDQVMDCPEPVDCTQIRQFLELCGFYRRFVKNFATIAARLSSLLQKEKIWDFGEECKASFQRLKLAMVEATTLQFPDPDAMFHVHTDSSNIGIGAVLSQNYEAGLGLRPVAYTSWKLTDVRRSIRTMNKNSWLSFMP